MVEVAALVPDNLTTTPGNVTPVLASLTTPLTITGFCAHTRDPDNGKSRNRNNQNLTELFCKTCFI
ncbi:hypothetical protein ADIARSV_2294 [Arcticibacter svalbardensis MN12-7]|uniref:Uncharacterized protein n=1 Tax=Arcticibacter svalbardensis MN12-7 TaxID=1150600 RepID=R9GRR6_9SPHI|nr:hypothetical protein ADIARSV_2294 [Arcticibacter svalbardensis MN12-7]